MQKKLNTAQQETLFASECKLINLRYEYQGYTGTEIWAIVSELSEKELFEKYPDVISRYTSGLKKSEETAAKEMVVALATQKAEELDAVAVLSNQYRGCYPSGRYVSAPIYIYISKSKNGRQYLDSLGGAAVTLAEEQYKQESFLVERAALDRAHAA